MVRPCLPRRRHSAIAGERRIMRRRSTPRRPTGKDLVTSGNFPGVLAIENNEGYICRGLPYCMALEQELNKQAASTGQSVLH